MKTFKDLTINEELYCIIFTKDMFPLSKKNISDIKIEIDEVVDKYNFHKIVLKKFGIMEFNDVALEKSSHIFYQKNIIMVISTSDDGLIEEIKKMFKKAIEK